MIDKDLDVIVLGVFAAENTGADIINLLFYSLFSLSVCLFSNTSSILVEGKRDVSKLRCRKYGKSVR